MVYRVYVSKKEEFAGEDRSMFNDLKSSLGIKGLRKVKIYNRYDIEGVDKETFETEKIWETQKYTENSDQQFLSLAD